MKILLLAPHPFYQERGTPIAVRLLAHVLAQQGHILDILTYHEGTSVDLGPSVRILRIRKPPRIHNIRPGFSLKKLICDLYLGREAMRLVEQNQYDCIHAVEEAAFIAMYIRRRYGIPYVMDMDSSMPQQMAESKPWLRFLLPVMELMERAAIRRADGVVVMCDALARKASAWGARHVTVLRDISLLSAPLGDSRSSPPEMPVLTGTTFMYIGNLEPYQGVDLLLQSFALARLREKALSLVIVGGTKKDIAACRARTEVLGCPEAVHFLGAQPTHMMSQLFQKADVLVSPRTHGTNTPMKIYSYLDSGKAVLATNLPTHTQVLTPEVAVLASPEPMAFATAMLRLAANPELRKKLANRAGQLARQYFSFEVFRKTAVDFYADLEKNMVNFRLCKPSMKRIALTALAVAGLLWCAFALARGKLIPFGAGQERRALLLTGDEPEYLLAAYSLAHDGDMDIHNNEKEEAWRAFQNRNVCGLAHGNLDHFRRISPAMKKVASEKWGERQLLIHRPGTSVLISPATWSSVRIRWWAGMIISTFAAAAVALILWLAVRAGVALLPAGIITFLLLVSPPTFFYANQIFPEIPFSALLVLAFALLVRPTPWMLYGSAVCVTLAPWFSDRSIPAAFFAAIACLLTAQNRRERIGVIIIFLLGALLLIQYYLRRFNVPWPICHHPTLSSSPMLIPSLLPKVLFDRSRGFLWICPALILAPAAFWRWWTSSRQKRLCVLTALAFTADLLSIAAFPEWHGGTCPAGRYAVLFQWLLLLPLLMWARQGWSPLEEKLVLIPLFLGFFQSLMLYAHPNWWFRAYHPLFAHPKIQPWYDLLPRLQEYTRESVLKTLVWILILALYTILLLNGTRWWNAYKQRHSSAVIE